MNVLSTDTLEHLLLFVGTLIASSGFWMYMIKRLEMQDASKKLLMGLAHDRIMYLSMRYIERGWIFRDEYENLRIYLYEPYIEMKGDGASKRLMDEVDKLPITSDPGQNSLDYEVISKKEKIHEDKN